MSEFDIKGINPFEKPLQIDFEQAFPVSEDDKIQTAPEQEKTIDNNYDFSKADKDFNASNENREKALKNKEEAQQALQNAQSSQEIESAQKAIEEAQKIIEKSELTMGNSNSDSFVRKIDGWS